MAKVDQNAGGGIPTDPWQVGTPTQDIFHGGPPLEGDTPTGPVASPGPVTPPANNGPGNSGDGSGSGGTAPTDTPGGTGIGASTTYNGPYTAALQAKALKDSASSPSNKAVGGSAVPGANNPVGISAAALLNPITNQQREKSALPAASTGFAGERGAANALSGGRPLSIPRPSTANLPPEAHLPANGFDLSGLLGNIGSGVDAAGVADLFGSQAAGSHTAAAPGGRTSGR